jgi:hypothetical protein
MTALAREAERLEALARRPLQARRALLLDLAVRLRALDALPAAKVEAQLSFDREWMAAA